MGIILLRQTQTVFIRNQKKNILRNVGEIRLLFPEMKITTNLVYDWCVVIELKRTIKRILVRNYKKIGVRQWTYYE